MPIDQTNFAPDYNGEHLVSVDQGRRLLLPNSYRGEVAPRPFRVVKWPVDKKDFLLVLSPEQWRNLYDNALLAATNDDEVAALERALGHASDNAEMDRFGRLVLPQNFLQSVGITEKALILGRVNKFEIWSPEKRQVPDNDNKTAAAIMKKLILFKPTTHTI